MFASVTFFIFTYQGAPATMWGGSLDTTFKSIPPHPPITSLSHTQLLSMCAEPLSHVRLSVTPMDRSPPGFSVHGILQVRILEWVAISSSMGSSRPRNWQLFPLFPHQSLMSPALAGGSLSLAPPGKPHTQLNTYETLKAFSHVPLLSPSF